MFKHLFNGDDYQIIFTAKNKYRKNILKYAKSGIKKLLELELSQMVLKII